MPKYMIYCGDGSKAKNQLQEAIENYLRHLDRTIVADVEMCKARILEDINTLNAEYKRCKPEKPSWWQPHKGIINPPGTGKEDWNLSGIYCVNFKLYAIREVQNA